MSVSRRQLLAGAGAVVVLAACGDGSKSASGDNVDPGVKGFSVLSRAPNGTIIPGKVRLPVSLGSKGSLLQKGPATLNGRLLDANDQQLMTVSAGIRSKDMVIPYWPFNMDIAKAGNYTLRVDGDDGFGAAFTISDPASVDVPYVGAVIPPFDTPTVDNHRGVEPYCTLTPNPCPFHAVTLTQALASGKPVAYMIGTPAHCQTGVCGPALEFLVKSHERYGDRMVTVHADVYSDSAGTEVAPAVQALNLSYEPVLYLCKPGGEVRDRIDVIWDQTELDERINAFLQ
jgi:hypothetical protein